MFNYPTSSKIGIIGYGAEGTALVEYLLARGFQNISVLDKNINLQIPNLISGVLGETYLDNLASFDVIFRSPGTPYLEPNVQNAIKEGVVVSSITEEIINQYSERIIGVTGSNGKTTTTALIEHIFKTAKLHVIRLGNDSTPNLSVMDNIESDSVILMELSSFQLQPLTQSPHVSIITNITPNHLDYHHSMEEYTEAKCNICAYQGKNDHCITPFKEFALTKGSIHLIPDHRIAFIEQNNLNLPFWDTSLELITLPFKTHPHSLLCAIEVASLYHVTTQSLVTALQTFKAVPHRLEHVGTVNGIPCYNDSSSTTPESTITAMQLFGKNSAVLLGGSPKNISFATLGKEIVAKSIIPIVYGQTADEISKAIHETDPNYTVYKERTMQEAFLCALQKNPTAIILSPACASFDQFPNAKVRGKRFSEMVENASND